VKAGPAAEVVVTQTDLANMVGGSRQSVNQVLHSFERLGYLELDGRRIVIRKPDLLHQRAGQFDRSR
jgi:CRP/FNR family transcriptional regulator, cyclic AMP receptor protein